ncbi:MAG: hypothetical protein IIY39_03655, partial [Firmicutes bacterium]|nr:hypothetical protein [Bacillota bacterium]
MEKKLREFFDKLLENRMRRAVALVLAIIVTFTTTYTLVLPAITLEKDTAETMSGVSLGGNEQDGDTSTSTESEDSDDSGLDDSNNETVAFDAEAKNEDGETEALVHVEADIDTFPAGTTMEATVVTDQGVIDSIAEAAEGEVVAVRAVDLKFTDENGETVQASEGSQLNVTLSPGEGDSSATQSEEAASDSEKQIEKSKDVEASTEQNTETTVVQYTEDKGAEQIETNDDVTFQVEPENDLDTNNAVSFDISEQSDDQRSQTFAIVETVPEVSAKGKDLTDVENVERDAESETSGDVSTAENKIEVETEDPPLEENPGVLTAQEESSYIITMTYGPEALIPEDAYLQVEEILETETYDTHLEETQKALNEAAQAGQKPEEGIYAGPAIEEELQFFSLQSLTVDSEEPEPAPAPEPEIVYARFFDITILKPNGEEVTPAAQVKVAIELLDAKQDEEVIQ